MSDCTKYQPPSTPSNGFSKCSDESVSFDAIALNTRPCVIRAFWDIHVPKSLVQYGTLRKSHSPS